MTAPSQTNAQHEIETAFLSACAAELQALKPGNVHVFAGGHDMDIAHFEKSASAAAPIIADANLPVGRRIKHAVAASMEAAGCNTNLGIILLCVPIAAAFETRNPSGDLKVSLDNILSNLDQQDADDVFAAIREANPGGLGTAEKGDVHTSDGNVGLIHAMRLAANTDRIAKAYISNFDDIFTHHIPIVDKTLVLAGVDPSRGTTMAWDDRVVTTLYMHMLQDFPDSHIVRKFGAQRAATVQDRARDLMPSWAPLKEGSKAHQNLLEFDQELKKGGINPGTSADFVVATLFTSQLCRFAAR